MENNKYFTPDIEDLCIGYECEYNFARAYTDEFHFVKIGYKDVTPGEGGCTNELTDMIHLIDDGAAAIRVPYLTNQQLENEGWTYYQNIPDMVVPEGYIEYYKDVEWFKVVISISETSHYLDVQKVFQNVQIGNELQEFRNTIYNGECKDINTFRKLIKLLGI